MTALTLLDLSAAFDTIDHLTLISHLSSWYGISGTALDWFTSVLSSRCQQVKIHVYISEVVYISFGVPQGFVLRLILFNLYTATLSHAIAEHVVEHHLYADDTQIYISLSGSEALESLTDLKTCVTDVFNWMTNSKVKLNPSKTEFIIIGSKKTREKSSKIYPLYYYLTMTHVLKHSLEIWDSFFIVILTSNDKSLSAKYASITSVTFGVLGSTLAQKLQNLLHVLWSLVILTIAIPFCTIFLTGTLKDCSGYKIVWHM